MTRKRARTEKGHFVADDPNTPENEAYVDEEPKPKAKASPARKARQKNAPKNENKDEYVYFVSSSPENGAFDLRLNDDVKISGRWDAERAYVHWRVPRDLAELAKMHHHIWSGRIISCEDD